MMQHFRHFCSLSKYQILDSTEYESEIIEHEGINKCGVGMSWLEVLEKENPWEGVVV